jgi:hypothetical protein
MVVMVLLTVFAFHQPPPRQSLDTKASTRTTLFEVYCRQTVKALAFSHAQSQDAKTIGLLETLCLENDLRLS